MLSPFFCSYPQKSVQQTKPVYDLCDYTLCIYSYVIPAKISENMPPYIAFSEAHNKLPGMTGYMACHHYKVTYYST